MRPLLKLLLLCAFLAPVAFAQNTNIPNAAVSHYTTDPTGNGCSTNQFAMNDTASGTFYGCYSNAYAKIGGGAPSGPAGGGFCSGSTYPNPLDCTPVASYTFSVSSGTITATPNIPSGTIYSGTDLRAVWDSVAAAIPNGGTVWFKNGTYPCNTLDQESTGGFSNYYCIGIPAGGSSQYVQWFLVGESNAPIIDQFSTPVQTNGVIINVTSTAVSSVPTHSKIMGIWARPDAANSVGVSVFEENLDIRVPTNQRGCETESDLSQALNSYYFNVVGDTAVAQNSLAFPVEDSCTAWGATDPGGLIGLTTTNSIKEQNNFIRSFAIGADVGFDLRSEHTVLDNSYVLNSNHGIDYAVRGGTISATSTFTNSGCATTARCLTLGTDLPAETTLTLNSFYFEDAASGAFAPVYHAKETSSGNTSGTFIFGVATEGVGAVALSNVFDGGGGGKFLQVGANGTTGPPVRIYSTDTTGGGNLLIRSATSSNYASMQYTDNAGHGGQIGVSGSGISAGALGPNAFWLWNDGVSGQSINLATSGGATGNINFYCNSLSTTCMSLSGAGALTATGSVTLSGLTNAATGDYVCYNAGLIEFNTATCTLSLRKYKIDIAPLNSSLAEVMRLRPVEYRYKPELKLGNRLQVGLIADEVAKVDPRIGAYKDNGELESVDYEHMTAVLAAAIQEQQKEIAILKRQVSALRRAKRP